MVTPHGLRSGAPTAQQNPGAGRVLSYSITDDQGNPAVIAYCVLAAQVDISGSATVGGVSESFDFRAGYENWFIDASALTTAQAGGGGNRMTVIDLIDPVAADDFTSPPPGAAAGSQSLYELMIALGPLLVVPTSDLSWLDLAEFFPPQFPGSVSFLHQGVGQGARTFGVEFTLDGASQVQAILWYHSTRTPIWSVLNEGDETEFDEVSGLFAGRATGFFGLYYRLTPPPS